MTDADAPPPDDAAPLSVDEAVELLAGPEAEFDSEEGDEPSPDPGNHEEIEPERDAPHFWSAEDKAAFAALPPELQETVARYEKNRDDAAARVIQAAAEARNVAAAQAQEAVALSDRLAEIAGAAEAEFAQRWGLVEPDWAGVVQAVGPQEAQRLKHEFDRNAETLQRLAAAKQEAEARSFSNFVAAEFEKLKAVQPELAEPVHGAERRQAVVKFLESNGVSDEQIRHIGAVELAIAYDALRYQAAMAGLTQSARSPARRPAIVPAAAQPPRPSQHRRAEASKARFAKKPSIDNAVAAILAKG